jgi:hypothetical protein
MTDTLPLSQIETDDESIAEVDEFDLHEEAWAEIDAAIDEAKKEISLKLATVTAVSASGGGPVAVQFHSLAETQNLGYAHVMGSRFRVGQRVVVAPLEGGDYVVLGAITDAEGGHESIIGERDLETASVSTRNIIQGAVDTFRLAIGAVDAARIAGGQVLAGHIAGGQILSGHIAAGQINASHIARNAITNSQMANRSVGGDTIMVDGIKSEHLSTDARNSLPSNDSINAKLEPYVKENELSDYVKENELAPNAKGNEKLATEDWVKKNYEPKAKK